MVSEAKVCPSCGAHIGPTAAVPPPQPNRRQGRAIDLQPGQTFADRFTIIERVSGGGMGVVYKAIDNTLGGVVALKLIRPELAQIPSFAERFRREVRLTRQITHPNVCRVHDIDEQDGVSFLSMEWIDGETLDRFIRQAGPLREARALQIAQKIALALQAAHEAGVIHRDLKPANVMIDSRGNIRVLDFGLAAEPGAPGLTGPGVVVGTPQYMAPEQRDEGRCDARADLYALGLILLEMLLGHRASATVSAADPAPELNPALKPVLRKLLAEDPADRFPSAAAAQAALKELESLVSAVSTSSSFPDQVRWRRRRLVRWAALALALASVSIGLYLGLRPRGELPPAARGFYERGRYYLAEESEGTGGIDSAIQMFHKAHNTAPDSALIMAALAEAYWMRFRADRLNAAREEAERWVANAARIDPHLPELANARAIGFLAESKHDAARAELERALAAKPKLVSAWLNLAWLHRETGDYDAGLEALHRAERLDPGNYVVQLRLGRFHDAFQEYERAAKYYRRAGELKPDSRTAWNNLAADYLELGRLEEAAEALRQSLGVAEHAAARSNLGSVYYFLDRYEDAAGEYRRAAELEPQKAVHWGNLGDALRALDRESEAHDADARAARAARERVLREPLSPEAHADAALYCAQAGDEACALASLRETGALPSSSAKPLVMGAAAWCLLGRDDEALDWLDRAVRFGVSRAQIDALPQFQRLRDHPRYRQMRELAR
jgi:tetratricopeptide (TPR) repeat protein